MYFLSLCLKCARNRPIFRSNTLLLLICNILFDVRLCSAYPARTSCRLRRVRL